ARNCRGAARRAHRGAAARSDLCGQDHCRAADLGEARAGAGRAAERAGEYGRGRVAVHARRGIRGVGESTVVCVVGAGVRGRSQMIRLVASSIVATLMLAAGAAAQEPPKFPPDSYMAKIQKRGTLNVGVKAELLGVGYQNP